MSLVVSFSLIGFILNPDDKDLLHAVLITLGISLALWVSVFGLISIGGNKTKEERKTEFINLLQKIPLMLLSTAITSVYIFIIFFFFSFVTVSNYGGGGIAGDSNIEILSLCVCLLGFIIIGVVMNKVLNTDKQDFNLTIYNQFSVLKWASLIVLPFGIWASYYFYKDAGGYAWVAMVVWAIIFYMFYRVFSRISEKVQGHIQDASVNRILHEKKKKMVNDSKNHTPIQTQNVDNSLLVADELTKLKLLLDTGVITQEEFDKQKSKLI